MADALVTQLARALNLSPDAARHTLNHLIATLREQIEASGAATVPGLGTFSWEDDGLVFAPEDALARDVNHRYAGLKPISAGPAAAPAPPPPPEPEDPLAAELPSAAQPETRAEPESETAPPAEFQPLEAFIEPEVPGPEVDESEPDVVDAQPEGPEVTAEDVLAPDESLVEHEAPFPEEEPSLNEEPAAQGEDVTAPGELDAEEKAEINALLAGISPTDAETRDEEDSFEPVLDDGVEDVDYPLEEPQQELQPEPQLEDDLQDEAAFEEDLLTAVEEESFSEKEYWDEEDALDEVEEGESNEEVVPAEASPVALTSAPPLAAEPAPEPPPPALPPTMAPAVAATAAARDRRPAEPSPGSNFRLLAGVGAVLLLAILALLWFLNREAAGPTVAERPPVSEDTVAATPPPLDTLSAATPADTMAVAASTPEPETPEPAAPEPSSDPLRSTAGIDPEAGGWTWVVASEFDRATAERRVAQYRDQGLRADVIAGDAGGRTRYRVSLGQFATTDEANRYRSDLPTGVPEGTWLLQL